MADNAPRRRWKNMLFKMTRFMAQKKKHGNPDKPRILDIIKQYPRPKKVVLVLAILSVLLSLVFGWRGGFNLFSETKVVNHANPVNAFNQKYGVPQKVLDGLMKALDEKGVKPQDRARIIANSIQKYKALENQFANSTDTLTQQAAAFIAENKLTEAENLFKQAQRQNFNNAANSFYLAQLNVLQLNYPEAKGYYQQAVLLEPENPVYLNEQGIHLYNLGEYTQAEAAYAKSLAIREKMLGKNHPVVAESLNNLAVLYHSQGNDEEAESLYQRSMVIDQKALNQDAGYMSVLYQAPDSDNNDAVSQTIGLGSDENLLGHFARDLNNLAMLYKSQGRYAEAEPLLLRSLAIKERNLGKQHFSIANSLSNLKNLYNSQDKYTEDEALLLRSLAIKEKNLGKEHPSVAESLNELASLYKNQGKYAKAEPLLLRSLTILEARLGKNHPRVAMDLNNLALLYQAQHKDAEAEPLLLRSIAILEKSFGKNDSNVAQSLNNLALLYQSQGKIIPAEFLFTRSLAILEQNFGKDAQNTKTVRENLQQLRMQKK